MTPEAQAELDKIRAVRGYTLPLHEVMAEANVEFIKRYGELASFVIFGPGQSALEPAAPVDQFGGLNPGFPALPRLKIFHTGQRAVNAGRRHL